MALPEAPPLRNSPPPVDAGLPRDRCQAVDPEDRRDIVYARRVVPDELWTVRDDGSGARPLGGGEVVGSYPAWSPDGCAVAFITYSDEGTSVVFATADGSNPTTLYSRDALLNRPEWSPNGEELVFTADGLSATSLGPSRMFKVSARGGPAQEITPPDLGVLGRVAWSPDGDELAFSGLDLDRESLNYQLYAMRPDGSGLRRLTRSSEGDGSPDWSPDGRRLAFTRTEGDGAADDGTAVFVVDRDGVDPTMVGSDGTDCCAVWSADARSLLLQRDAPSSEDAIIPEEALWVVDVDSGEERRLVSAPALEADWSAAAGAGSP